MTASADPAIDLTYLSTELRILPTSPPWSATMPALERLDLFRANRKPYSQFKDDVAGVGEYAAMLAAQQPLLTNALFCSAVIGAYAGTPQFATNLAAGLRTISEAYRLTDAVRKVANDVVFRDLADKLVARWPGFLRPLTELRGSVGARDHDRWASGLRGLEAEVRKCVQVTPDGRREVVIGAWREWRIFLVSSPPAAEFEPGIENLLCRVGRIGPDTLLRDAQGQMTIVDWSTALYRSLAGHSLDENEFAPRWLAVVAALRLGVLGGRSYQLAGSEDDDELSSEELQQLREVNAEALRVIVAPLIGLVVHAPSSSIVSGWMPSKGVAAIAWTVPQTERTFATGPDVGNAVPAWLRIDHLFAEAGLKDEDARKAINALKRQPTRDLPVTAFAVDRSMSKPAWADRITMEATNATTLIQTAEARSIRAADAMPGVLKELWQKGGRLVGTIEHPSAVSGDVRIDFTPQEGSVGLSVTSSWGSGVATLVFTPAGLFRTSPFVRRAYRVLYDGVTLRLEEQYVEFKPVPGPLGRLIAGNYVPAESIELKETTDGVVGDLIITKEHQQQRRRFHLTATVGAVPA